MMDAFSELRARGATTSTDLAIAEFLRLEYPGETAGWLMETAESPSRRRVRPAASRRRPFWERILTWFRSGEEPRSAGYYHRESPRPTEVLSGR